MITGSRLPSSKLFYRGEGLDVGTQLRKANAIIGEKSETPALVDRDFGDRFPAVNIQDFTVAKQIQFVGPEESFSGALNFGAHSLNSWIDCSVVHKFQAGMQKYLQRLGAECDAGKVTALLPG
jgi:hypothetical protein